MDGAGEAGCCAQSVPPSNTPASPKLALSVFAVFKADKAIQRTER